MGVNLEFARRASAPSCTFAARHGARRPAVRLCVASNHATSPEHPPFSTSPCRRLPLYNSVHAEQFLLVNALHHGEREIRRLAVSAAPCGHCRQFYSELACAVRRGWLAAGGRCCCWGALGMVDNGRRYGRKLAGRQEHVPVCCASCLPTRPAPPWLPAPSAPPQESVRFSFCGGTYSLGQLLPMRFKPADLLPEPAPPLLLQPQHNGVQLAAAARVALRERAGEPAFVQAAADALQEAVGSYAPYSRCPAGVAIITADGGVYSGGYIESAAYNPSLPPLQTAIVDAVIGAGRWWLLLEGLWALGRLHKRQLRGCCAAAPSACWPPCPCNHPADGMPCYTAASEVVLVELAGGAVQHAPTARVVLEQIAPQARLTVLHAEWMSEEAAAAATAPPSAS